jgi:hypothetical protein
MLLVFVCAQALNSGTLAKASFWLTELKEKGTKLGEGER